MSDINAKKVIRRTWCSASMVVFALVGISAESSAREPDKCISDAELEAVVGEQVRQGRFAIDTSGLRQAPMCSGLTVAQAIQNIGKSAPEQVTATVAVESVVSEPVPNDDEIPGQSSIKRQQFVGMGRITGRFGYPSDYIPDDITACAEPLDGGAEFCTRSLPRKDERNASYSLAVPAGRYRVYARTGDSQGEKAYFTNSVVCGGGHGGESRCGDHTPVIVEVAAGTTRSGINPDDWYDF